MRKLLLFIIVIIFIGVGVVVYQKAIASNSPDTDGDKLNDFKEETIYHTERLNPDTDGDGYLDGVEVSNGFAPYRAGEFMLVDLDSDRDGMNDAEEIKLSTDLLNPDTDGDGVSDFLEQQNGSDPKDSRTTEQKSWNFLRKLK